MESNAVALPARAVPRHLTYAVTVAVAVFFTFAIHEGAHWLAGELLGNDMKMTLNSAYPSSGAYLEPWHWNWISAAGPLITLLQAIAVFLLMRTRSAAALYPFLLTPAVMRVMAMCMNVIKPQDEGRISQSLGIGTFTLPLVVCAALAYLTILASRRAGYSTRFNVASIVLIVAFSSVLILASQ